jgi:pimeloyl-ACP methyl ester carboxylesterase
MVRQRRSVLVVVFSVALGFAQHSLPATFQPKTIQSPAGVDIFVRWGAKGPVIVLIHGYAENSDSWAPLAADLGYDKKTQAKDIRAVVTALGFDRTSVVDGARTRPGLACSSEGPHA